MPRYWRILLVILIVGVFAAAFHAELADYFRNLEPAVSHVVVVDSAGKPIPMRGRVDIFPVDRSLFMPSPLPRLASIELDASRADLELDSASYPRSVQVRFHVPGYGVDYTSVDMGRRHTFKLRLGRPRQLQGIVTGVPATNRAPGTMGTRGTTGAPIVGARVLALGGGDRGVVLAEAATGADGRYKLDGISEFVGYVALRVLKDGFALAEREYHWGSRDSELKRTDFQLEAVPPVRGEVRLPDGLRAQAKPRLGVGVPALTVTVLNYAGVIATVGEDGKFALHHLPVGKRYRLLIQGLPAGFTQRGIYAEPGQHVVIEVVPSVTLRGEVLSERLGRPIDQVKVSHTNSARGKETCVTDGYGRFELRDVPLGNVRLTVEAPENYFSGGIWEPVVAVEPQRAAEPVVIRVH